MQKFKLKEDGAILTAEFRVSFPNVFEKSQLSGKYGCGMMFPKDSTDMKVLNAAIETVILEKWGKKKPKTLALPVLDGDESDRGERAGYFYINGKAGKYKAPLVDREKDEITDPEEFYAGCWARAVITLYTYDRKDIGKAGVSVGIRSLQKLRDDEPLVSRVVVENEFDDLPDKMDDI
ncbi:MAG: DUF2815 family protein [Deltaproteobacteria bacterium]|nr:DUF2815 family protein [Deltaproteobacteria bacterium]